MEKFEKGLVSIIIPVFNREVLLPETLDSILSQTFTKWECIIVDDGSTDSSLVVAMVYASKDSRIKVFSRPWYKKKGANTCRNYGFELSKGEFIQWFDSDDIMKENYLGIVTKIISVSKKGMIVAKASILELNKGGIKSRDLSKHLLESQNSAFAYLFKEAWFQTSQVILKRCVVLDENNYFNIHLSRNQEAEYFTRLMLNGAEIECYVNQPIIELKVHDNSIGGYYSSLSDSSKMRKDYLAYFKMFKNFKDKGALDTDVLPAFQQFFMRCLRKMEPFNKQYFHLFFLGLFFGFYVNRKLATKIFITRNFKFLL